MRDARNFRWALAAIAGLTLSWNTASAQETIRVGLPTKAYWPTIVAEAALRQKLFEKEGLKAELTIYRGGAEAFEALAAGAADIILDPPALAAAGRNKGVMSKVVAGASGGYYGWQLMVAANSTLKVEDLRGKKVGITSAGSATDLLSLWTMKDRKIEFTRVPVGGGGLVPNLLSGNLDAAVVYSPLSFEMVTSGKAKTLIDFTSEVPKHTNSGWIVTDKLINEKPQVVQKAVNALFGGVHYLRNNKDYAVKLITEISEIPAPIATQEFEKTIMNLETEGAMSPHSIGLALEMASLGGMKNLAPAADIMAVQFKPVPTKP
jgi:ABC-type nitrate/sulfonate/bicarbonate transport system substrate-binding protein